MKSSLAENPEKLSTLNRRAFPHLSTVRSEAPDGRPRTYFYHRLSKVRIYAEPGTPEFVEDYRLAAEGHKTAKGRALIEARRVDPPRPTNVYFIRAATTGFIKVGKAVQVRKRLSRLQIGSSEPLVLLGSIPDTSGGLLETAIHRDFASARVRGEWFRPTQELLDYIARVAA